jgi:hypothetical protein
MSTKLAAEPEAILPVPGTAHELVRGYGRGLGGLLKIGMIVVVPSAAIFWIRAWSSPAVAAARTAPVSVAAPPVAQLFGGPFLCGRALHNPNGPSPGLYVPPQASVKEPRPGSESVQCLAQDRAGGE